MIKNIRVGMATITPAIYPIIGASPRPRGAIKRKLTQMNVRKVAGREHIQCALPLLIR